MSKVINLRNATEDYLYIGRGSPLFKQSIWANPYKLDEHGREGCIELYEKHLKGNVELLSKLPELTDKTLGCWCKPEACHGDVLSKYAHKKEGKVRLLVSGSRDIPEEFAYNVLEDYLMETILPNFEEVIIIEGGARGVDTAARKVAKDLNIDVLTIPAQWEVNGRIDKGAGYKRNETMLKLADAVFCIWDGKSKGTLHAFERAKKLNKNVLITKYLKGL